MRTLDSLKMCPADGRTLCAALAFKLPQRGRDRCERQREMGRQLGGCRILDLSEQFGDELDVVGAGLQLCGIDDTPARF